jgi:uncharacterized membrane protein
MSSVNSTRHSSDPRKHKKTHIATAIERNIAIMAKYRQAAERKKSPQERLADTLTGFSGSMLFVYLHVFWFGLWIVLNMGGFGLKPFDPFPFGLLTLIVSLEAIFLSTFVLISQNRANAVADKRADLDLQIDLFSEHEITRLLILMDAIAEHLGVETGKAGAGTRGNQRTGRKQKVNSVQGNELERSRTYFYKR